MCKQTCIFSKSDEKGIYVSVWHARFLPYKINNQVVKLKKMYFMCMCEKMFIKLPAFVFLKKSYFQYAFFSPSHLSDSKTFSRVKEFQSLLK